MNRGEIWLVQLNPSVGSEIGKTRPVIIVSNNAIGILPLKVIISITYWKERYAIAQMAKKSMRSLFDFCEVWIAFLSPFANLSEVLIPTMLY